MRWMSRYEMEWISRYEMGWYQRKRWNACTACEAGGGGIAEEKWQAMKCSRARAGIDPGMRWEGEGRRRHYYREEMKWINPERMRQRKRWDVEW